jgi:hypothetical protein
MEEFIHNFEVEWLLLQTEDFNKYFAGSKELRRSGKSGESSRVKRISLSSMNGAEGRVQAIVNRSWSVQL